MRAFVFLVVAVLAGAPLAFAAEQQAGHWEVLGEDGVIWVPHGEVEGAYLPPAGLGDFHDHAELTVALQALAAAHPDLVTLTSLGASVEGRALWAVTLRAGPDDGRPALLFDGAHHGDEVIASEVLVRYAQGLAAEYPATARSRVLDDVTLVIVPMVNPDGIARAHTAASYADARKNAHGVDLNRNYAATWGGPGSSGTPSSATYRGPAPASEPETRAMQDLLRARNWTFYSSLHSGAEMILWPYGHTTQAPPEAATYQRLGDELTAITSAPNGQVSRILYSVSGDSMDAAYVAAGPHWKPLATSPETYEGSGNAADWWYLFNPPDAQIGSVVARWSSFLDHLAAEAPHYAPPRLDVPAAVDMPGAPFALDAGIAPPAKRAFVSGDASLEAPGFLAVASANPLALPSLTGPSALSWSLAPTSGGAGEGRVTVRAGPAGNVSATVPIVIRAPAIELTLSPVTVGSGESFTATMRLTGPEAASGTATLTWQNGTADTRTVAFGAGGEATWSVTLNAGDALPGPQSVRATFAYATATESGSVSVAHDVLVDRPWLVPSRSGVPDESPAGEELAMQVLVRNHGTRAAHAGILREVLPASHLPWVRNVGPIEPVAKPMPDRVSVSTAGQIVLEWDMPVISPRGSFRVQLAVMPAAPGEVEFLSEFEYEAQYPASTYSYEGSLGGSHTATMP